MTSKRIFFFFIISLSYISVHTVPIKFKSFSTHDSTDQFPLSTNLPGSKKNGVVPLKAEVVPIIHGVKTEKEMETESHDNEIHSFDNFHSDFSSHEEVEKQKKFMKKEEASTKEFTETIPDRPHMDLDEALTENEDALKELKGMKKDVIKDDGNEVEAYEDGTVVIKIPKYIH
ncbi:hypothetical protein HMI54_008650 [Coelomomyces lativittatus]|nr:hypothetical protein HMI56_004881 [Coelomomyces lativittatus]KAJ1502247.1 hypothetical protein HMI55_002989 [Coelomomyces lativittatus]KAJ1502820.1 hypothetical protein HMI54_008650 [Coelomomyces lativittatus]